VTLLLAIKLLGVFAALGLLLGVLL